MEIVENTLGVGLEAFLDRPLFCFLAQESDAGPRISPLWFLWEDATLWNLARLRGRSYPDRVNENPRTAVAIVDFDPATGRVEHVGMRGTATLESFEDSLGTRLLGKYLGPEQGNWPRMFIDLDPDDYRLIAFEPETVVARDQSYPDPTG